VIQFVVGGKGTVQSALVKETTLGSPQLEQCVIARVKSWTFPIPHGGGVVTVSYPFHFASSIGSPTNDSVGQADVLRVVLSNRQSVQTCVVQFQTRKPGEHGTVMMTWTINADGHTSGINCTSQDYRGTLLDDCLKGAIKRWVFPPHSGPPQTVPFPFKF
jgi:outer membrane biosynthesis protein TonB